MRRMLLGPWVFALTLACTGAGDDGSDPDVVDSDAGDTGEATADEPTVDEVRACILDEWFVKTCTGCHTGGNHLALERDPLEVLRTTNQELAPTEPLLVPGDPDASILVRKVLARAGLVTLEAGEGDPMPPDTTITETEARRVEAWVASGAPDCPE